MRSSQPRPGFIMLISVLAIGTVAAASAAALLLLGLSIERNSYAIQISSQAFAGAWSCAEHALAELQENISYEGNREINLDLPGEEIQTCRIYPVGGDGNFDRILCTEATYKGATARRLYIRIDRIWPTTQIESWKEVSEMPEECGVFSPSGCSNGVLVLNGADGTPDTLDDEECDDNNQFNNDGCSIDSKIEECGDGVVQASEQCDDTNTTAGDGCDGDCKQEYCGDGTTQLELAEECDLGVLNNDFGDDCTTFCRFPKCGDNITQIPNKQAVNEQCDNGGICSNVPVPCADDRDCPGGACQPQSGDTCNATCQNETVPPQDPGTDDLILWWKFDETSGTTADNAAGSSDLDGKWKPDAPPNNSPDWSSVDKAPISSNIRSLHFDGVNDFIQNKNSGHGVLGQLFPEQFSVSFWVKNDNNIAATSFSKAGILCKSNNNQNNGWGFYFKPSEYPDECEDCDDDDDDGCDPDGDNRWCSWYGQKRVHFFVGDWEDDIASAPIVNGFGGETVWHHVVGTYDGENLKIYVDGVETSPQDGDANLYAELEEYAGSNRLKAGNCGGNSDGVGAWDIDGLLDDIRVYEGVLTPSNIEYLSQRAS